MCIKKFDRATELPKFGVRPLSSSLKSGSSREASQIFRNTSDRGNVRKLEICEVILREASLMIVLSGENVQIIKKCAHNWALIQPLTQLFHCFPQPHYKSLWNVSFDIFRVLCYEIYGTILAGRYLLFSDIPFNSSNRWKIFCSRGIGKCDYLIHDDEMDE